MLSVAYAQSAAQAQNPVMTYAPIVLIFVVFYFFMIRPQQKRAKEMRELLASIKVGDEVLTSAGIMAKVVKIDEIYVDLEIANNTVIKIQKQAIINLLPKGSFKK